MIKPEKLKFYADTPAGDRNKLFSFRVKSLPHAVDLAARFVQEYGFRIRSAYYQNLTGRSIRIDLLFDLNTHQNTLIEQMDTERKLELARQDVRFENDPYIQKNFLDPDVPLTTAGKPVKPKDTRQP